MPYNLLIVEDNETDQRMLSRVLGKGDFHLTYVPSRRDAVSLLGSDGFDCVLTDLRLKNGFGFETIYAITTAAKPHSVPVIVITGLYDEESALRAMAELGVAAYLDKNIMLAQKHGGIHPLYRIIIESIARGQYLARERAETAERVRELESRAERSHAKYGRLESECAEILQDRDHTIQILTTANDKQAAEIVELCKDREPKTWLDENKTLIITNIITGLVTLGVALLAK